MVMGRRYAPACLACPKMSAVLLAHRGGQQHQTAPFPVDLSPEKRFFVEKRKFVLDKMRTFVL